MALPQTILGLVVDFTKWLHDELLEPLCTSSERPCAQQQSDGHDGRGIFFRVQNNTMRQQSSLNSVIVHAVHSVSERLRPFEA